MFKQKSNSLERPITRNTAINTNTMLKTIRLANAASIAYLVPLQPIIRFGFMVVLFEEFFNLGFLFGGKFASRELYVESDVQLAFDIVVF